MTTESPRTDDDYASDDDDDDPITEIVDTLKHDFQIHSMLYYSLTTRLKRV